jgi:hypothetical protein
MIDRINAGNFHKQPVIVIKQGVKQKEESYFHKTPLV